MNRRDFIRSLLAALTTALLPWGVLTKSKPVDSVVVDWQNNLRGPARGGKVRDATPLFENEGHEYFVPGNKNTSAMLDELDESFSKLQETNQPNLCVIHPDFFDMSPGLLEEFLR